MYVRVFSQIAKQVKSNDLRKLGNLTKITKLQIENFVNTSKKLRKNRYWTFPIVCYLTRYAKFFCNILSMIMAYNFVIVAYRNSNSVSLRFPCNFPFCRFWMTIYMLAWSTASTFRFYFALLFILLLFITGFIYVAGNTVIATLGIKKMAKLDNWKQSKIPTFAFVVFPILNQFYKRKKIICLVFIRI